MAGTHTLHVHNAGRTAAKESAAARRVQQLQQAAGAFAYLCMQPRCNPRLLCASAAALRSVGGWRGPMYVITDHPELLRMHCEASGPQHRRCCNPASSWLQVCTASSGAC